ncbi:MerR family transcriptional regulator [Streptomyces sp. NPDC051041]|uniref:MerR family transcriptional regulator n=1 Tax=Streptomyces sp. NPDC051041 TaxID=3365640 RepID=UPI0037B73FC3
MRIGELAEATGTTPRALRHYEQAGLIVSERAANGYRLYAPRTAVRVRNIRLLLDTGLTLDDVRVFLSCLDGDVTAAPASDRALEVAAERLAVMDARIAAQLAVRDRLAAALRRARRSRPDLQARQDPGPRQAAEARVRPVA